MRPYTTAPTLPARRLRALGLLLALAGLGSGVEAQVPVKPDTAGRDSLPRFELPTLTVTRTVEPLDRVPAAVGFLGRAEIRRSQLTIGADEALTNLPGVYVANRYNFSVDQRISVRGAGSRANFGARGVKILLDDVPQTLPDGQSQLTNVEFGTLDRVEVLRGAASSLYGNASGGVISFRSEAAGQGPLAAAARLEGGAAGSTKWQVRGAGRSGRLGATLSASRFLTDGFRQQSAAEIRQLNVGAEYALSDATELRVRLGLADTPKAENPGALTEAEYAANPDSAPANNINRHADKAVQQQQLAVTVRHTDARGNTLSGTVFGLLRDLDNPLATNNIVVIDRRAGGIRLQASRHLGAESAPRLTAGIDGQVMQDDRQNYLGDGAGKRTDSLTIDQVERVSEVGPFAQLTWSPQPKVTISAGVRYDNVQFEVDDLHLTDGVDNSGDRTMSAWSGNLGVSYAVQESFIPYANVSTAFETPTTTELVNQPDGSGGFNDELGPQRAVNFELGARGELGRDLSWSLAVFQADVEDAIVQYLGRSGGARSSRMQGKPATGGSRRG
jgi:iron complex outermembrane receptor protein